MNRFSTRLLAVIVGSTAAVVLAGCGTGQISQTADQAPAVNGAQAARGHVALRDVRIQADQNGDYLQAGQNVDLVLVATNQSSDITDELTGITSDVGPVTVTGDKTLPAGGTLIVGPPGQARKSAEALNTVPGMAVHAAKASVTLKEPISNGVNYTFTFTFAKAGPIELAVPISAAEGPSGEPAHQH